MRYIALVFSLLACLAPVSVVANCAQRSSVSVVGNCAQRSSECCGKVEAEIHALYWKPMQCASVLATKQTAPVPEVINQDIMLFSPDYDWGAEAKLAYRTQCYFAQISYLWYENRTTLSARSGQTNLVPPALITSATAVRGQLNNEYQNFDVRLGRDLCGSCGFNYSLFVNGRWVQLDRMQDNVNLSAPVPSFIYTKKQFHGGAFGIGAGCEWSCGRWIRLFGEVNPMIAIGNRTDFARLALANQTITDSILFNKQLDSEVASVPAIDSRLGASISCNMGCMTLGFDFGWSMNYYWDVYAQPAPPASTTLQSISCDSVGFSGPFFGLILGY